MATYNLNDGYIAVSPDEWESIQDSLNWLWALEAAGVDNWGGIGYAHELYNEAGQGNE